MNKHVLLLFSILIFLSSRSLESSPETVKRAVAAAACYWIAGHAANSMSLKIGTLAASDILSIEKPTAQRVVRDAIKHTYNPIFRRVIASHLLSDATNGKSMRGLMYESGRHFLTVYDFFSISYYLMAELHMSNADISPTRQADNYLEVADDANTITTTVESPFIAKLSALPIALTHFIAGYGIAKTASLMGDEIRAFIEAEKALEKNSLNKEPYKKLIESTFGITAAQLVKPFMLYLLKGPFDTVYMYDSRFEKTYDLAYQLGDKLFWAQQGFIDTVKGLKMLVSEKEHSL